MNELFKDTFFGKIDQILASGKFSTPEVPPLEDGEKVIGECTDLEKAVITAFESFGSEGKTLCEGCQETPEDRASAKCAQVTMLKSRMETLSTLFWQLVNDRLGERQNDLGIREGFQIVEEVG